MTDKKEQDKTAADADNKPTSSQTPSVPSSASLSLSQSPLLAQSDNHKKPEDVVSAEKEKNSASDQKPKNIDATATLKKNNKESTEKPIEPLEKLTDKNMNSSTKNNTEKSTTQTTPNLTLGEQITAIKKQSTNNTQNTKDKKRHPLIKWIFLLVLIMCTLAILATIAFGFHYVYTHMSKKIDTLQANVSALENNEEGSTSALNQKIIALNKTNDNIKKQNNEQNSIISSLNQRIESAEQRLASQRKRILSMSTTSRDDWLLAEAEYLIKLANQRMLVERNAQGASALLVEVDTILKDMGDPDLFPVRQQLAKDITAVRLIEKIDVEGLFLKLNALTQSIDQLPLNPTWQQRGDLLNDKNKVNKADELTAFNKQNAVTNSSADLQEKTQENTQENTQEKTDEKNSSPTFSEKVKQRFNAFTDKLDNYIRIRNHDTQDIEKLLIATPQRAEYLKQNLQLMLERASLALLREQQKIFDNSLDQAKQWLMQNFPDSAQRNAFILQINEVQNTNVVQTLPDITQSLEALKTYINELHALQGTANQKGSN